MPIQTFRRPPPNFNHMPIESGTDVDKVLVAADATLLDNRRNAGVISMAIMRIMRGKRYGMRYLETRYRALDSATYLVGVPQRLIEPGLRIVGLDGKPRPFFLWVGVNGQTETNAKLTEIGATYDQNLSRLDHTGFLTIVRH